MSDQKNSALLAAAIKSVVENLRARSESSEVSGKIAALQRSLPEHYSWSFTIDSLASFVFDVFMSKPEAFGVELSHLFDGEEKPRIDAAVASELAEIAMSFVRKTTVELPLAGAVLADAVADRQKVELTGGVGLSFGERRVSYSGLRKSHVRECSISVELDCFSPRRSSVVLERAADIIRKSIAILWVADMAQFSVGMPFEPGVRGNGARIWAGSQSEAEGAALSGADPLISALSSSCSLVLPRGDWSFGDYNSIWEQLDKLDGALRAQVHRSLHFLAQALASHSSEDRVVSLCVAFECLLAWGNGAEGSSAIDNKFRKARIADRAMILIAGSQSQREQVMRKIGQLYSLRSELVHGGRTRIGRQEVQAVYGECSDLYRKAFFQIIYRFV